LFGAGEFSHDAFAGAVCPNPIMSFDTSEGGEKAFIPCGGGRKTVKSHEISGY
jgi:hypothetical protein